MKKLILFFLVSFLFSLALVVINCKYSIVAIFAADDYYTFTVNSTPVVGITIGSATGHGGETNYTISAIPSGSSVSLTAPDKYVFGGITYYFSRWSGDGCWSNDKTINVSMTTDRNCTAQYHKPYQYHCYATCDLFGIICGGCACGLARMSEEDISGTYSHVCVCCDCMRNEEVSWPCCGTGGGVLTSNLGFSCQMANFPDCSGEVGCFPQETGRCEMTWQCYDCGITCNPECPSVCCSNTAQRNPGGSIHNHDSFVCENCLPEECVYGLSVTSSPVVGINISSATGHGGETGYTIANIISKTSVSLTAPDKHGYYEFLNWSDCDAVDGPSGITCNLTMNSNRAVTANYLLPVYDLSVNSSPIEEIIINSATGHGGETNYNIADIPAGTSVSLTATSSINRGTIIYYFKEWTGSCTTTDYTCELTMDADKEVTANYKIAPTAAIGCQIVDCGGPGCECNGNLVTYQGMLYNLLNNSILPDSSIEYTSRWYRNGTPFTLFCTEYGGASSTCHASAGNMPVGTWTIRLEVEDEHGASSTAERVITVRRNINANFECSLATSTGPWQNCSSIAPLSGQTVYFRDISTPSEGATDIITWRWEKGYIDGLGSFVPFGPPFANTEIASTTLTTATNTIRLTVWDNTPSLPPGTGRSDSETKTLRVTLPLPQYRPVVPLGRLDNFLAKIVNIFR